PKSPKIFALECPASSHFFVPVYCFDFCSRSYFIIVLLFCLSLRRKRLGRQFLYFALIQPQNTMAPSCECQIMRRDQRRQLMLPMQSRNQLKNQFSGASVEVAGGF